MKNEKSQETKNMPRIIGDTIKPIDYQRVPLKQLCIMEALAEECEKAKKKEASPLNCLHESISKVELRKRNVKRRQREKSQRFSILGSLVSEMYISKSQTIPQVMASRLNSSQLRNCALPNSFPRNLKRQIVKATMW